MANNVAYTFAAWHIVMCELQAERDRLTAELPRVHPDSYGAAQRHRQLRRVTEALTAVKRAWTVD